MAATAKNTASQGKAKANSHKGKSAGSGKSGRCWSGYEPVPGKKPYSKGSCRKTS